MHWKWKKGGAAGISVLAEPKHFKGSLNNLAEVRKAVKLPILMKDIIVSTEQIEAASNIGADAVLLIQALFDRGYCETSLRNMIAYAPTQKRLEVLLETHNDAEFKIAAASDADLLGINNRDLGTFTDRLWRDKTGLGAECGRGQTSCERERHSSPPQISAFSANAVPTLS